MKADAHTGNRIKALFEKKACRWSILREYLQDRAGPSWQALVEPGITIMR